MTTSTVTPEIAEFARGVRAALSDLPAEEVDDLTDGLEADLAEAYAEDLQRELPDPSAYATELRTAAGLPVRPKVRGGLLAGVVGGWRDTRTDIAIAVRRNPALSAALDFLAELRPAWWILRAWVAYEMVALLSGARDSYVPTEVVQWLILVAFAVVSVQWGRGSWRFRGLPGLIAVGNVVAVVMLVPVLHSADSPSSGGYYSQPVAEQQDLTGVYLNGAPVTNIFAYGADGKRLEGVQLFDQDGKPLATSVPGGNGCLDPECIETGFWTPSVLETGQMAWNVFPMSMVRMTFDEQTGEDKPDPSAHAQDRKPPYVKVPAVQSPEKVAEANR
jgi:hypothetical protein